MRSIILALAFAAPLAAVAATPNTTPNTFTSPMSNAHQSRPSEVYLTFVNHSAQDRELVIGDQKFKVRDHATLHVFATVGSEVRISSETNSKVNGQMLVAAGDQNHTIDLK